MKLLLATVAITAGGVIVLFALAASFATTSSTASTPGAFPPNLDPRTLELTADELNQAARALGEADRLDAEPLAVLAMMVAALGESHLQPKPNNQGSGYAGVFQADPDNIPMEDTEQQAHYFLVGGKGFQAGGAMYLAKSRHSILPGKIATMVEAGGQPAEFYEHWRPVAEKIIAAWHRPPPPTGVGIPADADATEQDVLDSPGLFFTPTQRADLQRGGFDHRLLSVLAWMGASHRITITALRADHSVNTVNGNRSNHADGRAADIGAVDGEVCSEIWAAPARWGDKCGRLLHALTELQPPLRPTELIYCWDPDGPDDPRGFARADHCDHVHVGFDA